MRQYDCLPSVLDGTEINYDNSYMGKSKDMPNVFNYSKTLKNLETIKDQGSTSMCVAYSLSYILESYEAMNGNKKFKLDKDEIYNIRSNKSLDGMQPKEALEYIKNHGYKFDKKSVHRIHQYGKLNSVAAMKNFLYINGPILLALPVKADGTADFWNGTQNLGGHAITCVGYNKNGLILENSWGSSWATKGKTVLPYEECNNIREAWGIVF